MTVDRQNEFEIKSAAEKKREMLKNQLNLLEAFHERNAITKEDYDKGVAALKKDLEGLKDE